MLQITDIGLCFIKIPSGRQTKNTIAQLLNTLRQVKDTIRESPNTLRQVQSYRISTKINTLRRVEKQKIKRNKLINNSVICN